MLKKGNNREHVSHLSLGEVEAHELEEAPEPHSDLTTDAYIFQGKVENSRNHANVVAEDLPEFVKTDSHQPKQESHYVSPVSLANADETKEATTGSHQLKQESHEVSPISLANADEKKEEIISEASLNFDGLKQEGQSHKYLSEAEKNTK